MTKLCALYNKSKEKIEKYEIAFAQNEKEISQIKNEFMYQLELYESKNNEIQKRAEALEEENINVFFNKLIFIVFVFSYVMRLKMINQNYFIYKTKML